MYCCAKVPVLLTFDRRTWLFSAFFTSAPTRNIPDLVPFQLLFTVNLLEMNAALIH